MPVKLTLSRRRACGDEQAYLRIRITATRASDRQRLQRLSTGIINLRCPDDNR